MNKDDAPAAQETAERWRSAEYFRLVDQNSPREISLWIHAFNAGVAFLRAEVARLQEERDGLVGALKPFARIADEQRLSGGESHVACSIRWEDLAAAEARIRELEEGK